MRKVAIALILILCIVGPAATEAREPEEYLVQERWEMSLLVVPRGMKCVAGLIGGIYSVTAITLDRGVHERDSGEFDLPVDMPQDYRSMLQSLRLLVSEDEGKTWRLCQELAPDSVRFSIKTPRDGLYWYTLQTKHKDGKLVPDNPRNEPPNQRIYINTARRLVLYRLAVSAYVPSSEVLNTASMEEVERLRREVRDLRTLVEALQKRLERLEKQPKDD